jgi:predicted ATP-grasp superfamily ATP-dependent carboligase
VSEGENRPRLLLIGTGGQQYREYLLGSIGRHYRVHLLSTAEPTWEREHVTGWTVVDMRDTLAATELTAAARELNDDEPLAGVLAWDEARVLQAAKVAEALWLPGGDPDTAMRCRDKHLTRAALEKAGVPQPQSVLVSDVDEALATAESIGYPVVLKPRAMAASLGVVRVDSPAELKGRFAFARDITIPGAWRYDQVLVEECVTGEEISVDSAVHAGEVHPMFVARKQIGYAPYFEEVGHVVDGADPLLADESIARLLHDAHLALGFTDGMTHTELMMTAAGPKVIEVNARLGGDLIPYLGLRATGIDPGLAAAAVACGETPDVTPTRRLAGAVRFFYPDHDDTEIGAVDLDLDSLPARPDRFVVLAEPGEVMSPPPKGTLFGRVAFATAVADGPRQCLDTLAAVRSALTIRAPATAGGGR